VSPDHDQRRFLNAGPMRKHEELLLFVVVQGSVIGHKNNVAAQG
jgi:hypothetical protein